MNLHSGFLLRMSESMCYNEVGFSSFLEGFLFISLFLIFFFVVVVQIDVKQSVN